MLLMLLMLLIPAILFAQYERSDGRRKLGGTGVYRPHTAGTIKLQRGGSFRYLASIDLLNAFPLVAGDSVFFKCGQTYRGQINITSSGTAENPIVLTSYGAGAKPIISGAELLTGWVSRGDYYATKATQDVKNLYADGVQQTRARTPNNDGTAGQWARVTSPTGKTATQGMPAHDSAYWIGGKLRVRTSAYTYENRVVSADDGTTITIPATAVNLTAGSGFFCEGVLGAMDTVTEWHTNATTDTVYMVDDPTSLTVEAVTQTHGIVISGSGVTVNGLDIRYTDSSSVCLRPGLSNVTVTGCTMTGASYGVMNKGILAADTCSNITLSDNTISEMNSGGIYISAFNNSTITRNDIQRISLVRAYDLSGTSQNSAIKDGGIGNTISGNRIDSVGYNGVQAGGVRDTVEENYITNVCLTLHDGGGIYSSGQKYGLWRYNIVDGVIGDSSGWPSGGRPIANGLYIDQAAEGFNLHHNTAKDVRGYGLFSQFYNTADTITDNTFYRCGLNSLFTTWFWAYKADMPAGMVFQRNTLHAYDIGYNGTSSISLLGYYNDSTAWIPFGVSDTNYWLKKSPIPVQGVVATGYTGTPAYSTYNTLAAWIAGHNLDSNSVETGYDLTQDTILVNTADTAYTFGLTGTYRRPQGDTVTTSLEVPAHSSQVLIRIDGMAFAAVDADNRDARSREVYEYAVDASGLAVGHDGTYERRAGAEFQLYVPQGSTIDSAFVQLVIASNTDFGATDTVKIEAFDVDNAEVFVGAHPHYVTGHAALVGASVDWPNISTTVGTQIQSPDIKTLVQPVVSRESFASGNYFGVTFSPKTVVTSHRFTAYSYGQDVLYIPRIRVFFH